MVPELPNGVFKSGCQFDLGSNRIHDISQESVCFAMRKWGGVEFTLRVIALPGRMIQSRRAAPPAVMLVSFGASHSSRARAAFYDTILYYITLYPYASCRSNGQACSRSARVNREGPRFRLGFPPRDSSVGNGRPSQGPASSPPVLLVKKNSTSTEHMIDLRAE